MSFKMSISFKRRQPDCVDLKFNLKTENSWKKKIKMPTVEKAQSIEFNQKQSALVSSFSLHFAT